jgi:hypothetical protein
MKLRVFGTGAVMAISLTGAALALPATSYAATCYTGCHTISPTSAGGKPTAVAGTDPVHVTVPLAQAHALAFTGANVILPTGIGAGAVLVGGALMYVGKRRRYNSAS